MADMDKQRGKLSIILLFCFLLSACSLKKIDEKIGEQLNKIDSKQAGDTTAITEETITKTEKILIVDDVKREIDNWISKNNLNRYGDKEGAVYTGGTPLFNEATGENIDRYEYILKKHPELNSLLKNNQ